jgi:hypothetical protein
MNRNQIESGILNEFQGGSEQGPQIPYTEENIKFLVALRLKQMEEISIGPLGSCQYTNAWITKELVVDLHTIGGWDLVQKTMGISIDLADWAKTKEKYLNTPTELFLMLASIMEGNLNTSDPEEVEEYNLFYNEVTERLLQEPMYEGEGITTALLAYIEYTRNTAWDLWSASIPPIKWEQTERLITIPTFGPIFNSMAQSDNFAVGIDLALWEIELNFEASNWEGYDT